MYNVGYIGYKEPQRVGALLTTAALIKLGVQALPTLIPWVSNVFQAPARDAKRIIDAVKPTLYTQDARTRMASVISASQKISPKARDVDAELWLLWYRNAFPNDYMDLTRDDKIYFNTYLDNARLNTADGNNMHQNLISAMFTNDQINYAPPSLIDTTKSLTTKAGFGSIALIGLIGAGIYFFTKKKTE